MFVQPVFDKVQDWTARMTSGAMITARLPGAVINHDGFEDFTLSTLGYVSIGSTNVPFTCAPIRHHYMVVIKSPHGRPKAPPRGLAREISGGRLRVIPSSSFQAEVWYRPVGGFDPCQPLEERAPPDRR